PRAVPARIRRVADVLSHLGRLLVGELHLTDHLGRHAAGRAVLLQALDHLGLGRQESLKKGADLVRLDLLLAGGPQRRAMLLGLVPQAQELLAGPGLVPVAAASPASRRIAPGLATEAGWQAPGSAAKAGGASSQLSGDSTRLIQRRL